MSGLTLKEIAQIEEFKRAISTTMKEMDITDEVIAHALIDMLVSVTVIQSAGQAVSENRNPEQTLSKCAASVVDVLESTFEGASGQYYTRKLVEMRLVLAPKH